MEADPRVQTIVDVVRHDLCVSCGACVVAAGRGGLDWAYDKRRALFVPVAGSVDLPRLAESFGVCPGKGVELMRLADAVRSPQAEYDPDLGFVLEAWAARSTVPAILEKASSGGIMTGVANHLLASGEVTGVLATRFTYCRVVFKSGILCAIKSGILTWGDW